jgi:diguanylate cyclase (GGDEF)-like protein
MTSLKNKDDSAGLDPAMHLAQQIQLHEHGETLANLGHWLSTESGGALHMSKGLVDLLECGPDLQPVSYGELMRYMHPDDRGLVSLACREAETSLVAQELWHRIRLDSGLVKQVRHRIESIPHEPSGAPSLFGVIQHLVDAGHDGETGPGSEHDNLTRLPNRAAFKEHLEQALLDAQALNRPLAVVFLGVDHFKRINAGFGHEAGDAVLRLIGKRLSALVEEGEPLARVGGDEFAMVLGGAPKDQASVVARIEALASFLREPYLILGSEIHASLSVGYSLYPGHGDTAVTLIRKADISMHQAKVNGRNGVQGYQPGLAELAHEKLYLESGLRQALEQNELEMYYQPQVCLASGRIIGAEALMRWHHPELGAVPPDKFIPLAEESGLILELGEWALQAVAAQAHEWKKLSPSFERVAVNISGIQLNRSNLLAMVTRVLASADMDPTLLELELTESVVMHSSSKAAETLEQLHASGISIAVDDFGTGYSSLAYLQKLPINKLKLDKSFIRGIATNPDDLAIARAIVGLGKSLRLTVMAEGVETQGQRDILEQEGCEQVQGYLYGKPMPALELTALLTNSEAAAALQASLDPS